MDSLPAYPIRSLRQAGAVLKARRAARKISQKQLGEMTGTAQSTISDIENGVVLNRPGFPRGFFVQNLRGFFKGVHLCVERLLHFLRRPMTDGAV